MEITRNFQLALEQRIAERLNFIQVIIGPRQVGKTTGVKRVFERYPHGKHFASADSPVPMTAEWLRVQWDKALTLGPDTLLIIDEVQKVEGWAEATKILFDAAREERKLKVVLLGSASLSIEDGLASSLAGRFELLKVPHWSARECKEAFSWDSETFLRYGGYPAAAELATDFERWQAFMLNSIIEPVLGRDISGLARIAKPALFRQAFRLALQYPAQVISYQKLLGQLQDRGNATTIKHYLQLFEGAFLLALLPKYSGSSLAVSTSSPKIIPLAPALCTAMVEKQEKLSDQGWRGHLFEAAIGSALLQKPGRLYYWQEGNYEVDFIRELDDELIAYEVKSGLAASTKSLEIFRRRYPKAKTVIIDREEGEKLLFQN